MWMLRVAIPLLLLQGCCPTGGIGTCNGPPAEDSCGLPKTGVIDGIVIGHDDPFVAYSDGDRPQIVIGGQGSPMMGIRLKLTGSSVPDCLSQSTAFEAPAQGSNGVPLRTYAGTDGSYNTKALWIPGYFPYSFNVAVTAGGKTQRVRLGELLDLSPGSADM
jgi:hypothetical protein